MVPDAVTLEEVSRVYIEAGELKFFGAKVLHPMTLRPVIERSIPVWIRNSFQPEQVGELGKITDNVRPTPSGVKAVMATRDVAMISVAGPGIIGVPDIAARIFARDRVGSRQHRDDFTIVLAGQHLFCTVQVADAIARARKKRFGKRCTKTYTSTTSNISRSTGTWPSLQRWEKKHGRNAGYCRARFQHAGQGKNQPDRHRARVLRVQHFSSWWIPAP